MVLAIPHQAQRLEDRVSLSELHALAYDQAVHSHDHRGVRLRDTEILADGSWRYNGAAGHLSRHALGQLCARLKTPDGASLPASYLARCPSELLAENVNHWLAHSPGSEHCAFVRTREATGSGQQYVRAILSERYAPVQHERLLESLQELAPRHELVVQQWSLDDEQLTLRLTAQGKHPASLQDPLRVGLHVSNSEIGLGKVTISALITRLVCSNGLIVQVADLGGIRRRHVGRANESLDEIVRAGLDHVLEQGDTACRRFVQLRGLPAPQPLDEFLARTATQAELPDEVLASARGYVAGDTVYDVVNAFTRAAQDFPVRERVVIETAMSRFIEHERSWS